MVSTGAALLGGALIGGATSMIGASKAAGAAESAADTAAGSQMAQLEYLKEREALPQAYREQAIQQLGALYGLPGQPPPTGQPVQQAGIQPVRPVSTGTPGGLQGKTGGFLAMAMGGRDQWGNVIPGYEEVAPSGGVGIPPQSAVTSGVGEQAYTPLGRQDFVDGLREDPFYQDLLGAGEEAVLRGASATGGLRSGTASENLARNNQNILRGLYGERVAGLQGMAGLPSNVNQIGNVMGGIGTTQAAGQVAAGQAWQGGLQGISDIAGSATGQYLQYSGRGFI